MDSQVQLSAKKMRSVTPGEFLGKKNQKDIYCGLENYLRKHLKRQYQYQELVSVLAVFNLNLVCFRNFSTFLERETCFGQRMPVTA